MQSGVCLQTSDAVVSAGSALAVVRRWWVCPLSTASDVSFPRVVALALVWHWCGIGAATHGTGSVHTDNRAADLHSPCHSGIRCTETRPLSDMASRCDIIVTTRQTLTQQLASSRPSSFTNSESLRVFVDSFHALAHLQVHVHWHHYVTAAACAHRHTGAMISLSAF